MWMKFTIPLVLLVLFTIGTDAQARRARIRQQQPRPAIIQPESEEATSEEDSRPVIQYYRAQAKQDSADELVYVNEEEFQNLYAQQQRQQAARPQPREYNNRPVVTTVRPISRNTPSAPLPRSKSADPVEKAPPVQTIRNYNKVNDDGSFTFGYEAADGSFKEETRGTDCVVRGRYGYVDPEGNKREFTYVSGNPCDPNNPDGSEEEEKNNNNSDEDLDENIPQNYPKRPIPARPQNIPRPSPRPSIQATTRAPTTIFSNNYNPQDASEEEDDRRVQFAQIPRTSPRPVFAQTTPRRPSVQVIPQTTTARTFSYEPPQPSPVTRPESINITPKPLYRINQNHVLSLQQNASPQPPATTYRPQIVTNKPAIASTQSYIPKPVTFGSSSNRNNIPGSIDFDAEFKKFQSETGFSPVTPSGPSTTKTVKIGSSPSAPSANPIYQTQLVYNPSSGQYDANLYQAIAQTDGEFQLNQRIQPFVQQYQPQPQTQPPPQTFFRPSPQVNQAAAPQQVYQKQQNELQFVNSQQLFAQQVQQQQSQLARDRAEAAKRLQGGGAHRFHLAQSEPSPILRGNNGGQQYYYLQPSAQQSGGQIDAFLRGHNLEY